MILILDISFFSPVFTQFYIEIDNRKNDSMFIIFQLINLGEDCSSKNNS